MHVIQNIDEMIGHTPLFSLPRFVKNQKAHIFAKLEAQNPAGSVKDRAAKYILRAAEESGKLTPGGTVIEATSGNTGIALAALCAAHHYHMICVMPESMSEERKTILKDYGAELILTPAEQGMQGSVERAEELAQTHPGAILAHQFENPANPQAHFETTGPEIWHDLDGNIDIFVAGVGTSGTLTGVASYLKKKNPQIQIIAIQPASSQVLIGKPAQAHGIQGIGANFIPKNYHADLVDKVISVEDEQAYLWRKKLAKTCGILAGISSGAALCAAVELAQQEDMYNKNIVTIFPDTGERYLSVDQAK